MQRGLTTPTADVVLREGVDAGRVAEARRDEFERGVLLRVTAKITSGLDKNLQSSQIGLVIASVLSFLSASFIIMTGLTTGVTERQRELAVIRCVGGRRRAHPRHWRHRRREARVWARQS